MSKEFLKVFGHKLKTLRHFECISQKELADVLECTQGMMSNFELGLSKMNILQAHRLIKKYGKANFLFKWDEEEINLLKRIEMKDRTDKPCNEII